MEEAVSAADANRRFSILPRGVREGRSYVVTSHGKPVARLIPAGVPDDVTVGARSSLLSRLEKQPVINAVGARACAARAGGEVSTGLYNATGPLYFTQHDFQSGYSVGAGFEYAFTNNISAKAEYLFASLGIGTTTTRSSSRIWV